METNFNNLPPRPKNYLVESILVTILCCLPLGIIAIINATKVEGLYAAGDYESAQRYADQAKKWFRFALIGGIAYIIFILIWVFTSAAALSNL